MIFKFSALICGGTGPDIWDKEVEASGENMTIREALDKIEATIDYDGVVFSIEQID